ncbi:AAA domain-containing protein [Micromonospora echinospora]|uniref:AAA domain-containing protein n=1 Tax=Micromonospora echinospora TaxID=1877 RepID=UPI00366E7FC0
MSDLGPALDATPREDLVDRATRLFRYLAHAQRLRDRPPLTVDSYPSVLWLADLPHHPAVTTAHRAADPEPESPLIAIARVARAAPPVAGDLLAQWLDGPLDAPRQAPRLRTDITVLEDTTDDTPEGSVPSRRLALDDHPEVTEAYDDWLLRWQAWAEQEQRDRPVRDLYGQLFKVYTVATGNPEEYELVVGVGCLSWRPEGHPSVRRHLLTTPVLVNLDEDTGRLTVTRRDPATGVKVELDMLEPHLTASPLLPDVKHTAQSFEAHPLHRDAVGLVVRRLVHILDADSEYRDVDQAPAPSVDAVAAFAPALLLRRRSQQGLVEIYDTLVKQIGTADEVPDGLLPLIDPDHVPAVTAERTDGALVTVDDDPFLPLPVNDVQLRIIRQVDARAQTLVQGPPGTGKTHTAAALLSHLLAQGKRVLVTAHTDRALREVRDKLPTAIRPLSVSVVGSSREDMSELKVAVERIAAAAAERDQRQTDATVAAGYQHIDRLRRRRAEIYRRLVDVRGQEVREHHRSGFHGTLAAVATQHRALATAHGWLAEHVSVPADEAPPLEPGEMLQWLEYLRDDTLLADEPEAQQARPDLETMLEPKVFADLVAAEREAVAAEQRHATARQHPAFDTVARMDREGRQQLRHRLLLLAETAENLARRPEAWIPAALNDVHTGRSAIWQGRATHISSLTAKVSAAVQGLDPSADVTVAGDDHAPLVTQASELAQYLDAGNRLKVEPNGTPRIGLLTAKVVKQAQELFARVRVNGLPPTTAGALWLFVTWADAVRKLDALDRAWPRGLHIPVEDTVHERLRWHATEFEQLRRVLDHATAIAAEEQTFVALRLPAVDWQDLDAVRGYAALVDAVDAGEAATAASTPLHSLAESVADLARRSDAAAVVHRLLLAVRQRDEREYDGAYQRVRRLVEVDRATAHRDALGRRLATTAPTLRHAVENSCRDQAWDKRLAAFRAAWEWAATATWLRERENVDVNGLQAEINQIEERIRHEVEKLAAARAWGHAVAEDRLTGTARANLEQYAYLVRRHGKGTGKYAAQQRAEIRQAMDRCRSAVPVWIMPVYRIAEQLRIAPNMFDVVIVDEASQAGLEATFLQYLAPKIVVIGDDKQVSPSAVGVDQQQLRDLAQQYLADDPYRASWQDPKRSLFDEAKMRFRGLLTLVEHRRCVPEIIGFSNQIAYEPDGVRLIPVRQYGSDRLDPVRPVFVPDGYVRGTTNKINPSEVDAVVTQIEKCIADPRYDGLTFGVISLLGKAQAQAVEKALLERIPTAEWASRDLRCGDSADFQGSERDVVFLSMVAAPEPGQTLRALTGEAYVQRYNVAASRAKDQMWLFHSVPLADLGNPEDLRFRLLEYCYAVAGRAQGVTGGDATSGVVTGRVPHDRRVEPFDSLFEQRVYNRLYDRGYTVFPQYPVEQYRIDLVVIGPEARLAIECDGDAWHGPEAYERDLARQRELERCGWRFFRIRESAFYVDEPTVLHDLWDALAKLGIHPSGSVPRSTAPDPTVKVTGGPGPDEQERPPTPLTPRGSAPTRTGPPAPPYVPETTAEPAPSPDMALPDEVPTAAPEPAPGAREEADPARLPESPPDAAAHPNVVLREYEEFAGTLPPALESSHPQIIDGLRAIVDVEGPVLGARLHSAYVKASGGHRVGKVIAKALNSAITAAVRRGVLVADNPLGEAGVKPQTYRLPGQPPVRPRFLGVRELEDVPPRELATLLEDIQRTHGDMMEEALYRAALERLGLKRLTPNVANRLRAVHALLTRAADSDG